MYDGLSVGECEGEFDEGPELKGVLRTRGGRNLCFTVFFLFWANSFVFWENGRNSPENRKSMA